MIRFLCNSFPIRTQLHDALYINLFTFVKARLDTTLKITSTTIIPLVDFHTSILFWGDDLIVKLDKKLAYETLTLDS